MNSFKLKILISLLGGMIFSLIFILLALVLPTASKKEEIHIPKQVSAADLAHALKKSD
jgi:hypothetical protein